MFKEEILKNAGLKESVIIREEPPKPPKKKRKKVNEKVKLKSLLDELLLEAVDLADGSKVIRALERGQVPDVKKKVFLKTSFSREQIEETLNNVLGIVANKVGEDNKNKYMFLIMKRAGNVEWLDQFSDDELNEVVDSMMAYFGNKNKKEAKENEEVKKKFEEYENSKLSFEDDKKFEQWANEKFAHKAKAKDKDIDVVYDDGEWNVSIPKTFAAAKKLACMADRKATWCTAASENMFRNYTSSDNPLFIIRNEKKDVMYQMDWGKHGSPNFMDEKDRAAKVSDVLNVGIPDNAWKSIKNNENESVYDKLEPIINRDKNERKPLDDTNKTPAEELEGWNETVFLTVDDFMDDVKGKKVPNIFRGSADRMKDVLVGNYAEDERGGAKRIAKYKKDGETYYHIVPNENISLATTTYDKAAIIMKDDGSNLDYLNTNELIKADLPKFFTDKPLDNTEKTDGDMDGWNEYIYPSAGEFLREISNYQMPKMIGDVRTMTNILKIKSVDQIGKVSKGKNVYYYLIAKPKKEILLGSTANYKSFERVAFKLTGNKLTIKTAKTIAGSDLPDALKEKLFTRYKKASRYNVADNQEGYQSIPAKDLKKVSKSEMPKVAFQEYKTKIYTNVNTFGKIMNIPGIGENTTDKLKKEIMGNELNPSNIVAIIETKMRNKKITVLVMNNAVTKTYSNDKILDHRTNYVFKNSSGLSFTVREWILNNLLPNALSPEEKKIYEKIKNGEENPNSSVTIHTFKGGEKLVYGRYWGVGIESNGEMYYIRSVGRNGVEYFTNKYNRGYLPQEKVDELEKQGASELIQKVKKLTPR